MIENIIKLKKTRLEYRIEDLEKALKEGRGDKEIIKNNILTYKYAIFLLDDIIEELNK